MNCKEFGRYRNLKENTCLATILTVLAVFALAVAPAEASDRGFSVGAHFSVGGFGFALGFGGPRHYPSHSGSHYSGYRGYGSAYYRASPRLRYDGYQCHSGCYRDASYTYHHAACPVVAYHFRKYDYDPYYKYSSYLGSRPYYYYDSSRYGYPSYRGYRSYGRYDSHHGSKSYGRYDRYRRGYRDDRHRDRSRNDRNRSFRGDDSDSDSGRRHYRDRDRSRSYDRSRARDSRSRGSSRGRGRRD